MSNPKITPKNLSYDASLPLFLQRLHNSSTSNGAALDGRHERALARPKRARDADAEAEDEPVFVDEETGEVVSAEELKALNAAGGEGGQGETLAIGKEMPGNDEKGGRDKQTATIGAPRKRKAAKVVGGELSEEDIEAVLSSDKKKVGRANDGEPMDRKAKVPKSKAGLKGKKVKLSFEDDEEG